MAGNPVNAVKLKWKTLILNLNNLESLILKKKKSVEFYSVCRLAKLTETQIYLNRYGLTGKTLEYL